MSRPSIASKNRMFLGKESNSTKRLQGHEEGLGSAFLGESMDLLDLGVSTEQLEDRQRAQFSLGCTAGYAHESDTKLSPGPSAEASRSRR
jgi:hypothetical protein